MKLDIFNCFNLLLPSGYELAWMNSQCNFLDLFRYVWYCDTEILILTSQNSWEKVITFYGFKPHHIYWSYLISDISAKEWGMTGRSNANAMQCLLTSESFLGVWSRVFMTGASRRPITDTLRLGRAEVTRLGRAEGGAEVTMPGSPIRRALRLRVNRMPAEISLEDRLWSIETSLQLHGY